jgi:hypothetical protein
MLLSATLIVRVFFCREGNANTLAEFRADVP